MITLEIQRVGYVVEDIELAEAVSYEIDMVDHLNGDTVASHVYTVWDSEEVEKTSIIARSSIETDGILTIGVSGAVLGTYALRIWVTCNEFLPDSLTHREFLIELIQTVV